jgi:hypothetical protein
MPVRNATDDDLKNLGSLGAIIVFGTRPKPKPPATPSPTPKKPQPDEER